MGSQRQPGERTVESETLTALIRSKAINSAEGSRFQFASRTDRGVSALGNVAAFDTSFPADKLLRAMNANAEDVWFHSLAVAPPSFSARRASGRWYRYVMPAGGLDLGVAQECASLFVGERDFKRFCRADGRPTVRTIRSFDVALENGMLVLDVTAREFLRSMVRRMVAAIASTARGEADVAEVAAALGGEDVCFGLAPPEGLTLMDVEHDLEYRTEFTPTMLRRAEAFRLDAFRRASFIDGLMSLRR